MVRYTHYALMVTGPNRLPIVEFMKAQATESLTHAQQVGDPDWAWRASVPERGGSRRNLQTFDSRHPFREFEARKTCGATLIELLDTVRDASIYREEFARTMISTEEFHQLELTKMLRDFGE